MNNLVLFEEKQVRRVLDILKPHIFFDDQMSHLEEASKYVPSVHVPFGRLNSKSEKWIIR